MKTSLFLQKSQAELSDQFGRHARTLILGLLEDGLDLHGPYIDEQLNEAQLEYLKEKMEGLRSGTPLAYLTGWIDFYNIRLKVDSRVLIPRPETEELVAWASELIRDNQARKLLDIGTGSGCIALALKKTFPNLEVHAIDLSADALDLARQNADLLGLNVNFSKLDFLDAASRKELDTDFDIVVSNPPYIAKSDQARIAETVLQHEPELALFADQNGLGFYQAMKDWFVERNFYPELLCEMGDKQAAEVEHLFRDASWFEKIIPPKLLIRKDLQQIPRLFQLSFKG